jgi:hypothetical protein
MSSLAKISIRFNADLKQFSSQMQNAQRSMKKTGAKLSKIGSNMSMNFTAPIVAGLALVTKGTEELRSDLGRLETNAMLAGEGIGFMREQLLEAQAITGETDSSVEGLSNLLAAGFKGESLSRALNNISGAAVKFSDTLKFEGIADGLQETLATGKAIGPFSELLERSGVNLDEFNAGLAESVKAGKEQAYVLNTLASTGLEEVNKKYRENNKDVTKARKAQLNFQLAIADLAKLVQPIVNRVINFVTMLVNKFNELSPAIKEVILVVGGLLAAVGPILTALGFLMTTVIPGLIAAFGALSAPILAIVAAIVAVGVAIYKHWEPIKKTVLDIANYFIDLYNESVIVRVGVEAIALQFKILFQAAKLVFNGLGTLISGWWRQTKIVFSSFGQAFKAIITANFSQLPEILDKNLAKTQKNFKKTLGQLSNDVDNFKVGLQESISDSIDNIAGRKKLELYADVTVDNVKDSEQASGQGSGGQPQVQSASTLQSRGLMSTGIGSQLRADGDIIDQETTKINENLALFNIRAREIMAEAGQGFAEGFGNIIGNIATGNVGIQALLGLMLETFGNVAIRLGKLAISIGLAVEGIKKALENLNPGPALVAGIALVALGTIAKSAAANIAESGGSNREAFADGGIVSGPVNALVGEYAGARSNPEVIAPLDKLKSMLGDSVGGDMRSIQVEGKIKGQDIILQNARATNYRNRRG